MLSSLPHLLSTFGRRFGLRRASLLDLPADILLDELFTLLDVQSILVLRRVNRKLCILTHEPVIWKRFLRRMNVPIPPLPPTYRYSMTFLNNLEAERLLIRTLSLRKNFRRKRPEPFHSQAVEAFHHVQSMEILPGGKYLVASVRDETRNCYAIMIFALDYRVRGALPLAKMSTPTKAYNLQAKYMTFKEMKGIMIGYTLRDTKHRRDRKAAGGVDISEMSTETTLDVPVPIKYKCVTAFVTLSSLDKLSDPVMFAPGSDSYNQFAMRQKPPFRVLAVVRSSLCLGPVCLEDIFGVPHMAVVKGNDKIVFKNLALEGHSTLTCMASGASHPAPQKDYSIVKIRFFPPQASIFVIRRVQNQCALFETYPIPFINQHITKKKPTHLVERSGNSDQTYITDNPPLAASNLDGYEAPNLLGQTSRSISIFVTTVPDLVQGKRSIYRVSIIAKPWPDDQPLPRVPFHLPSEIESDPKEKEAFIRKYATHFYEVREEAHLIQFSFPSAKGRIQLLPGSNYSLLYWVADTITDCSTLTRLGIYFTPAPSPDSPGEQSEQYDVEREFIDGRTVITKNARIKYLDMWDCLWNDMSRLPIRCLTWDETIGRLCVAHENDSRIVIVDFAQAPGEDLPGVQMSVAKPDSDTNMRIPSLPDSNFSINVKL